MNYVYVATENYDLAGRTTAFAVLLSCCMHPGSRNHRSSQTRLPPSNNHLNYELMMDEV